MYNGLITCHTMTHAQKLRQLALRIGCPAVVERIPDKLKTAGCGYCIRLDARCLGRVYSLIRENGIPPGRVYRVVGKGFEAVIL